MKKLLISLLAALSLCAGQSQLACAAEPANQTPPQQTEEEQGKQPSPPPKTDGEEGKPLPCDCISQPEPDNN